MSNSEDKQVIFIQYDIPPLRAGEYTVTVEQQVNQQNDPLPPATAQFAVSGERFSFNPSELNASFPPDLATGEYSGVLPHMVFNRRTLPWERSSGAAFVAPWLAVLLFNDDEMTAQQIAPKQLTAKDLIATGTQITVYGNDTLKGTGTMPAGYFSYPEINPLDYGETPDDQCTVIDVPLAFFNQVAPTASDLSYLAQIREVDTFDSEDNTEKILQYSIVMGNRVPKDNVKSHAFLVSLENMGNYLPQSDGTASSRMPAGTKYVRLIVYRYWTFLANTLGAAFQTLLENLNKTADGHQLLTTVQVPFSVTPSVPEVELALNHQSNGALTSTDAQVLLGNAFAMGYVPLNHHMRHAGQTVSWYRGPLLPYPTETVVTIPISGPDAANRYNPQTGMFDVSLGCAWQLGQLLALQNNGFATALFNWKKTVQKSDVIQEEQNLINEKLNGASVFESLMKPRTTALASGAPAPPKEVIDWIANLKLLCGVPFQYLVPDESMLPPESLRFFYLDSNWMDALIDGAFSIGRATTGELESDAQPLLMLRSRANLAVKRVRANQRSLTDYTNETGQITGFLMRSQAVSGWPRTMVNGYTDNESENEVPKLSLRRLSDDVLFCLFDGVVSMVAIHEPPEQLHSGVEGAPGQFTTTLRAVKAGTDIEPGQQFLTDPKGGPASAQVPARSDNQTLIVASADTNAATAVSNILNKLNNDFGQGILTDGFTSAEFALEMVKGVVKVEFQQGS